MTVEWLDARDEPPARRLLAEANLLRHVSAPCRVLDVAGGAGHDGVPLAARGHEVTILDPAGAMLANALEHADSRGVADRVHVVQACAEDAPELFGPHDFDIVLCHDLLWFFDDPVALLRAVSAPLRAGGLLSVVGPERFANATRDALGAVGAHPLSDRTFLGRHQVVAEIR